MKLTEQLKNIKPNETINIDILAYGILLFFILFLLICIVFLFAFLKRKKKLTSAQKAKILLKNLDLENTSDKQIAYLFTKYARQSLNQYFEDEYIKIVKQLEPFKYKKDIPPIDFDLKNEIKEYIKVCI